MRKIWLSHKLSNKTPAYGAGEGFKSKQLNSIANGDSCNTALWTFPNHLGTHLDAPRHFYDEGITLDNIDPSFWAFNSVSVVEVSGYEDGDIIEQNDVLPFIEGSPELLLIKTGMGKFRNEKKYWENNPGLSPELGNKLKEKHKTLRAVGFDFISVSSWQNRSLGRKAHRSFLEPSDNSIVLIEDMDFSRINAKAEIIRVTVLPLRVENSDGAPCTVIAEIKEG